MRPSPALVVAIAALVVALGGVAYATIPGSDGVIHGCYLKAVGSLRVIDPSTGQHCTAVETPIQWNQTGPQGPQGATGPTGPVGPSDVFFKDGGLVTIPDNPLPGAEPIVVTLTNLPPGQYLVQADVQLHTATHTVFDCRYIDATGLPHNDVEETAEPQPPGSDEVMTAMPMLFTVDLPNGGNVPIQCVSNPYDYSTSSPDRTQGAAFISATKVGTLTGQ